MRFGFVLACLALLVASDVCARAVETHARREGDRWVLLRDGAPYFVKGVGGNGDLDLAARIGANSVRTWDTRDAGRILDEAQKRGMTVLLGLHLTPERIGFDYGDAAAVRKQADALKAEIDKYKDHPALLAWGIGNELDLKSHDPRVWDAVETLAKYIHATDPHHPAMTVTAGLRKDVVRRIRARAPSIDILGVNEYGAIGDTRRQLDAYGWRGPYLITEWGMDGYWEVPKTPWGAAIEQTSTEKRRAFAARYARAIAAMRDRCLGSYAFLWGWKQEYTATWFGLFLRDGTPTEPIDALEAAFTGHAPNRLAPQLLDLRLDGKGARDNIRLAPGARYAAEANARSAEAASDAAPALVYEWELTPESPDKKIGGDAEQAPPALPGLIGAANGRRIELTAPAEPGAYRLFVVVRQNGKAAYANVPFEVSAAARKK
ncbi:MAG: hypothetical protein QM741_17920 [Rudaea sp.]|uniref:hypothetical protein n=1 Tax=Rudaea sp. TaxID=2136325 RepID=UPI0039E4C6AC